MGTAIDGKPLYRGMTASKSASFMSDKQMEMVHKADSCFLVRDLNGVIYKDRGIAG